MTPTKIVFHCLIIYYNFIFNIIIIKYKSLTIHTIFVPYGKFFFGGIIKIINSSNMKFIRISIT